MFGAAGRGRIRNTPLSSTPLRCTFPLPIPRIPSSSHRPLSKDLTPRSSNVHRVLSTDPTVCLSNLLITRLTRQGNLFDRILLNPCKLFDRMPTRNVFSWNAMISGYPQNYSLNESVDLSNGMLESITPSWNPERGGELFDEMGDRNVVTWISLNTGYVQDGQNEMALKLLLEMLMNGIRPNEETFVSVLRAVGNLAALCEGEQIHQIISKTVFQFNPVVNSAVVSMYSRCGAVGRARKVFEFSEHKDLVSWNGMIAAYAHHGLGREAVQLFEEMQTEGLRPNDVTYVGLLSACSHSGLVDEGQKFFSSMVRDGSVKVRDDHYACLVDLCGRAGRLDEAMNLIDGLEIKPSSTCVWRALLSGCNKYGNVRLGIFAAEKLLEAEPNNAGTYMLLSNIYALAGRWEEAKEVRSKMKNGGLKKQPGCSWIEIGSRVHVFVARDKSHRESKLIYSLLRDLRQKMKIIEHMSSMDYLGAIRPDDG